MDDSPTPVPNAIEDQSATGKVRSDFEQVTWLKSNLQTEERADLDRRIWWNRFFARRRRGPVRSSAGLIGDLDLAFELRYLAEQIARATAAIERLLPLAEHDRRGWRQVAGHLAAKSRAERELALVLHKARGRGGIMGRSPDNRTRTQSDLFTLGEMLRVTAGVVFCIGLCIGLLIWVTFVFSDGIIIEPDNAEMWLDHRDSVFVSPPCLKEGLIEEELLNKLYLGEVRNIREIFTLSTMAEVRLDHDGRWRRDRRCNEAGGFHQKKTFWDRVYGRQSRWTPDGDWRW